MKIGIFGDSFTVRAFHGDPDLSPWSEMLVKDYGYNITNYGHNGSSIAYSFTNFLKEHEKFDKIIFVLSIPGRMMIPYRTEVERPWDRHLQVNTLDLLLEDYKTFLSTGPLENKVKLKKVIEALTSAKKYYEHFFDSDTCYNMENSISDRIAYLRPDALILSVMSNDWLQVDRGMSLHDLSYLDDPSLSAENDNRHCHLSEKNNRIFAGKIVDWLNTGKFYLKKEEFVYDKYSSS